MSLIQSALARGPGMLPALLPAFFCVADVSQKLKGHKPFYVNPCSSSVQEHHSFFFFCLLGIMMISRQWYEQKTRSLFLLKSTNILALISRYSFSCDWSNCNFALAGWLPAAPLGAGSSEQLPACGAGALCRALGSCKRNDTWGSFCMCLCVFHHLRLCSFSLNFLSWYENASFVFLSSFSSVVCGPARRAAGRSGAGPGQRCRRAGSPA